MLYVYTKNTSETYIARKPNLFRFLSVGLIFVGAILLVSASLPIVLYQIKSASFRQNIISSVSSYYVDYSDPGDWFPTAPKLPLSSTKITHYQLSVPKLKIKSATVEIAGDDLSKSLIHYPGTALPGQYGNAVIFGHSVLPQFYNPQNYKTIFSTLPSLNKGDEIIVGFDGVTYRYVVISMVEVVPQDISVLEQQYNDRYLSLVTCVPPGTYWHRLIVKSKLESF
jgi:sortase A